MSKKYSKPQNVISLNGWENVTIIATAVIGVIGGVVLFRLLSLITVIFAAVVVVDLLCILGIIRSEVARRFIITISVLNALIVLYWCWIWFKLATP